MDRLIETRHIAAAHHRHVIASSSQQQEDLSKWLFQLTTTGGAISLPSRIDGKGDTQLLWQLQVSNASTLSLAEVSLSAGQAGTGVQVHIEDQVFPAVPSYVVGGSCYLFLLLSSKSIGVLQVQLPGATAADQGGRQASRQAVDLSHSILDKVFAGSLQQLQLGQQQLAALGAPTAFTAADDYLCIAGSSGSVVCLPLQAVLAGSSQGVIQLLQTSMLSHVRRRMGFTVNSSVVAALPVDLPELGHQSLLVLHEDTSCQQWFVPQNRQGFSQTLAADAAARQLRPHKAVLCPVSGRFAEPPAPPPFDAVLVWDMGLPDRSGQSDVMVMPFKLQAAGSSSGPGRLEPVLQQPHLLQLEWQDALLVDAQVVGQQLLLLLCSSRKGGSCVVRYSCKDWSFMDRCQLLQQRGTSEWGMKEEMWSAALATCPAAITPGSHVLSQLLVPGQLCGSTLVQALDLHGARVSEQEVAAASLQQLQALISGTVELIMARYPSYGPARCWNMLFSSYCDLWQQQHGLQGLFVAPGGWCGLLRAGGMITVLRRATPAEALQQECSAAALGEVLQAVGASGLSSGIPGGAAAVAKVGLCLAAVADVLGGPTLRVMTQLVMAGVNVEGELLPKFVQLLLQGPPAPSLPSHADLAGGSGTYQQQKQQRLAEWRMMRQARLLSMQEQLEELPHALETLSGVAELVVKVAVAAAGQPQQPAGTTAGTAGPEPPTTMGNLVCSVALHTARATCMALQQVLLLLSCLKHLGSMGSTQLTAADQAAISTDLMPPLAAALRSSAVVLWLCKTPAGALVGAEGRVGGSRNFPAAAGPLLGLRLPTPSGTPAGTPRGVEGSLVAAVGSMVAPAGAAAAAAAAAPSWRFPLAAHWLAFFWAQQEQLQQGNTWAPGASLPTMGSRLAVWLMLGAGADGAAAVVADPSTNWSSGGYCSRLVNANSGSSSSSSSSTPAAAVAAAHAAVVSRVGLPGRAVLLGYQLFTFREYEAMKKLVALVGGDAPAEPGLQFILGLSLACGIKCARTAGDADEPGAAPGAISFSAGQDASALLGCALGHLFRAAAGFCSGDAAPLRLVLQLLRQRQGGPGSSGSAAAAALVAADAMEVDDQQLGNVGNPAAAAAAGDLATGAAAAVGQTALRDSRMEAVLRLQFCEAVMRLFEREGVTEGALAFARAALGSSEAAYSNQEKQLKLQQQAELWTSVFNFACDLQRHDDAYAAAVANPLPERAAESIKRLVQVLLDQGELSQLLSLPWAGVLPLKRDGVLEPIPVVELVTDKLVRRALHGEVSSRPSPYHVLFDFLTAWGSYKAAAASMLSYARRLRAQAASAGRSHHHVQQQESWIVEEVLTAYDSCLCMLQLLAPEDAWLDLQQPLLAASQAPASRVFSPTSWASHDHQQQGNLPAPVVTLMSVQQEAGLFQASAMLQQHLPGLEILDPAALTADYVMEQLVGSCLLPEALQFAYKMWRGEQLHQQLEGLVSAVAEACVKLQTRSGADDTQAAVTGDGSRPAGRLQQYMMSYTGPGYLGSPAAAAWEKLRSLLDLFDAQDPISGNGLAMPTAAGAGRERGPAVAGHDNRATGLAGRLRLAAVDGALSVQAGFTLPDWLVQPFRPVHAAAGGMAGFSADPAGLLRVYIKHGRLVDAAQLVQEHLEAWQRNNPLLRATTTAVWLPLKDMELLHASLVAGARRAVDAGLKGREGEVLGLWSEVLEAVVGEHVALARSDANKLFTGVQRIAFATTHEC